MTFRYSNEGFIEVLEPLPLEDIGWTATVLSERDYASVVAQVERYLALELTHDYNDVGFGSATLDLDDRYFTDALPSGETIGIRDQEALWQIYENGIWRGEFLAEDVETKIVDPELATRGIVISGRGTGSVLERAIVLPAGMPHPTSFDRSFTGPLMAAWLTLLAEAQARGTIDYVVPMFSATQDSAGNLWTDSQTITVNAGDNLLDLLTQWCDALGMRWRMYRGFKLQILPAEGNHLEDKVVFTTYRQQIDTGHTTTRRNIVNSVYVQAGDHTMSLGVDSSSISLWQRRERWVSSGDSNDATAASYVVNATLALYKDQQLQRTHVVPYDETGRHAFQDYAVGDWVGLEIMDYDTSTPTIVARHVVGLSIKVDQNNVVTCELTGESKFDVRAKKLQQGIDRVGGTTTSTTTSTKITVVQAAGLISLNDLGDVSTTSATDGQVLQRESGAWVPVDYDLDALTDVDLQTTTPFDTAALVYDAIAGQWVPGVVASGGGSSDVRSIFADLCYTSTLPGGLTTTGQLAFNNTHRRRELGGVSASTYKTPNFSLTGQIIVQLELDHLANLTSGNVEIGLFKASTDALIGRIVLQSDGNDIAYNSAGTSEGSSGTWTHVVGDGGRATLTLASTGQMSASVSALAGGNQTGAANSGLAKGFSTQAWASGLAGLASGDNIYLKISTTSTREVGLYRVRVSQGSPASSGGTGPTGPTGPAGGVSIAYVFSTTTTDADPGNGHLRLSNATQNTATVIRADLLDSPGTDWTAVLDTMDDSTSTIKGHLRLFKTTDPTKWLLFTISSIASPSGYRNITVVNVGSSAASPFADGDDITMTFSRVGDQGSTGATGPSGVGRFQFYALGTLATTPSSPALEQYNKSGATRTITKVWIAAATAPTGADVIVDILMNGTTIFSNPANRPKIVAGSNYGDTTGMSTTSWPDGSYITAQIVQVGTSGHEGAYLTGEVIAS